MPLNAFLSCLQTFIELTAFHQDAPLFQPRVCLSDSSHYQSPEHHEPLSEGHGVNGGVARQPEWTRHLVSAVQLPNHHSRLHVDRPSSKCACNPGRGMETSAAKSEMDGNHDPLSRIHSLQVYLRASASSERSPRF